MELRQLRHFVVLAEEMHFGRAAKRVFITQSALSTSVMRLEEEMNVRLFERDSKGMSLTPIGTSLLERAKEIVSLTEKLERFSRAMAAGRAGFIEAGFTATLLFRGLDEILKKFGAQYPEIEVSLHEFSSQAQVERLRGGRIDAAFINSPVPPAGLECLPLFEERFVACLGDQHALAGRRQIDAQELKDEVFVMFARDPSPAYYDHVIAICAAAGFQPVVRVAAAQVLAVVTLVATGFGVSIVPESVKKAGIAGVAYVPLRGVKRQPSAFMAWNPAREVPGIRELVQAVAQSRKIG
jgi:DNA-binding transcriptional LysR family regulator